MGDIITQILTIVQVVIMGIIPICLVSLVVMLISKTRLFIKIKSDGEDTKVILKKNVIKTILLLIGLIIFLSVMLLIFLSMWIVVFYD